MSSFKKVVLIQGGRSMESSISHITSQKVAEALTKLKINFTVLEADSKLYDNLIQIKPNAAFLGVHGTYGEDGILQGILEFLKFPIQEVEFYPVLCV